MILILLTFLLFTQNLSANTSDIKSWRAKTEAIQPIDTEFTFYPKQWLETYEEDNNDHLPLKLEKLFDRETINEKNLPPYGTFQFKIFNDTSSLLILKIPEIPAYRVFINGKFRYSKGRLSDDGKAIVASRAAELILLPSQSENLVSIQVTNDKHGWFMALPPIQIGEAREFFSQQRQEDLTLAAIIGGIFITAVYQFSIFLLNLREKTYIFFSIFCLLMCARLSLDSSTGFFFRFYSDFSWEWSWKIGFLAYYLTPILLLEFIRREFVGCIDKRISYIVGFLSMIYFVVTLATNVDFYGYYNWTFHLIFLSSAIIAFISLILSIKRKLLGSHVLCIGFIFLCIGAFSDIAKIQGLHSGPDLVLFSLLAFIVSQSLILAMKFSHSFAILNHTKKELSKIVYPHVVDRIVAGSALETTMPSGQFNAVIISFDIAGSTKIQHPQFPKALENLMTRLQTLLNECYDHEKFISNGYRLKEMGDGLLISVGFPFSVPNNISAASHGVMLSEKICQLFKEEMEKLDFDRDIFCGIGIVEGLVEGFFPHSGVKQYDLRGRAVNLATRYESMRKIVFYEEGFLGSVLFLQDKVYQHLTDQEKSTFTRWDCTLNGHTIRDDAHSRQAWYKFVPHAQPGKKRSKRIA